MKLAINARPVYPGCISLTSQSLPTITLETPVSPYNRIFCAALRDDPTPSRVDTDTFTFSGQAGETVTIRLNAFPFTRGN